MKLLRLLLPLLALLAGCETVNDTFVRRWLMDTGTSRRANRQIRKGLEKRESAPPVSLPASPAPAFMDEG